MDNLKMEVENLIYTIVAPHEEDAVRDIPENYFKSIDSIRLIELIVGVENKFGIEFDDEDLVVGSSPDLNAFIDKIKKYI